MTRTDYERWKDFSLRMAKLPSKTPPTKWVVEMVEWWFGIHGHPEYDIEQVNSWDQGPTYVCDNVSTFLWDRCDGVIGRRGYRNDAIRKREEDRWLEKWGGPVSCCIRAGLDLVAEPSMGVVGYTMGDLRKMYPEGFPGWLEKVLSEFTDNKKRPINLKTLKDSAPLWL